MTSRYPLPPAVTHEGGAIIRYLKGMVADIAANAAAIAGVAVGGAPGSLFTAADYGWIGFPAAPELFTAAAGLVSGTVSVYKCKAAAAGTIGNIIVPISTAGSGLTLSKVAIYAADGTQLGVSADTSTAFTTAGDKTVPLTAATRALAIGEVFYIALLTIGTNPPSTRTAVAAPALATGASTTGIIPRALTLASQTDMPATLAFSSCTISSTLRYLAAKN